MNWLSQNWVWLLFGVGMIAMHLFGHGGHGGHGESARDADKSVGADGQRTTSTQETTHHH